VNDPEDRRHVMPWLLGNFIDTSTFPRRIYLDLGINGWSTSVCWFLRNYPATFDTIVGSVDERALTDGRSLPVVSHALQGGV
jgi:hypothetical protein